MLENAFVKGVCEAGCDEAGRGCLAGPVFAAAVILPDDYRNNELNDSKKLGKAKRDSLRAQIEKEALAWAVAQCSPVEIDRLNILGASILAMHRAVDALKIKPGHLIIDGNRFKPYQEVPYRCFVKGDGRYLSIAAASVLAKTHRDEFMGRISEEFPHYNWKKNKGYPTLDHREAIKKYGACEWHRNSFKLLETQLEIRF